MAGTTLSYLTILALSATLIGTVNGSTFLKANPSSERISEADVQSSLLAEVESTLGEGSASSRVKQLEETLRPIYAALPKNEQGYLGHATVRYALHRLFVMRHGWIIKGLDAEGGHRNSTSGAGLLKEQVPAYVQDLFEKQLGGRGFGLHELGVLAATIEHLVHSETIKRLGDTLNLHKRLPTSSMSKLEAKDLLDTYMMSYILGEAMPAKTLKDAMVLKSNMQKIYTSWDETVEFAHEIFHSVTESEASPEQKSSGELDFALVARTADRIGEQFGPFQDGDCKKMKASLVKMEDRGSGRVQLSEFYKPALDGNWQFGESKAYLRQLGALDESDPEKPRVIIPNFITSPSNCIASSSFYSVCCMNECEGLLGHLEQELASPEAASTEILRIVSNLPSSSVAAPRKLSPALLDRLGEIAAEHGGTVPLHGRLFAQWLHHAFPRECPYPHVAGTTNPQTADEWMKENGGGSSATNEEMQAIVDKAEASSTDSAPHEEVTLPWVSEEELLFSRPKATGGSLLKNLRNFALFTAMMSAAFAMAWNTFGVAATAMSCGKDEKFMV